MITKSRVSKLIDEAETKYRTSWSILRRIREREPFSAQDMLGVQPPLAEAILSLSRLHHQIRQDERALINRKARLQSKWFRDRMALLARYREAVSEAIGVGRMIGDSFAWLFYRNESDLLARHLTEQANHFSPPGVGGVGEVAFISRVPLISGLFVLSHAITSFLRLGDVSLINLETWKVQAIGELKSARVRESEYQVKIVLMGQKDSVLKIVDQLGSPTAGLSPMPLSPGQKAQLKKQMKRVGSSLSADKTSSGLEKVGVTTTVSSLKAVYEDLRTARIAYRRAGDGLLILGIKGRRSSLSRRLLAPSVTPDLAALPDFALGIMDRESKENSLHYSLIFYSETGKPYIMPGVAPLFYWHLPVDCIERIIFHDLIILSIYNPLHLIKKLRSRGFNVQQERDKLKISRRVGRHIAELEHTAYFLFLITHYFFDEDSVADLIVKASEALPAPPPEEGIRVDLRFRLF